MIKKSFIITVIACVFLFCGCTVAEKNTRTIKNFDELNTVMANYSVNKNTEDLPVILEFMDRSSMLTRDKKSKAPADGFFMGIKHESPNEYAMLKTLKYSDAIGTMFKRVDEFAPDMEEILSNGIPYYPESPAFLDMLWGYFYATGDERVIRKLCYIKSHDSDPIVRGAAKWSFESNMEQFPDRIKGCN